MRRTRPLAAALLLAALAPLASAESPPQLACPQAEASASADGRVSVSWMQVEGALVYEVRRDPPPVPGGNPVVFTGGGPDFPNEFLDITNMPGALLRYTVDAFGPHLARSRGCPALEIVAIPFFPTLGALVLAGGAGGIGAVLLARPGRRKRE